MIEELAKNIYRIGVPLPGNPLKELNSYFIRGSKSDLLIDTGFRCKDCEDALRAGLQELGSDPKRRDVLITHVHADHSGMADLFVGPERRIYMSRVDMDYDWKILYSDIEERKKRRYYSEGFPRDLIRAVEAINPATQMALPNINSAFTPLWDGDIVYAGDYRLKTIFVPGHTPGNCMFWLEELGIMFSGDHVLFDITPNITRWEDMDDALGNYLSGLKKVKDYPVRMTLPGHRKTGNYRERIEQLLRHHERRLAETKSIIENGPGQTAFEIASQMKWRIRSDSWETFPLVQKWFAVGECLSHLDYLRKRGEITRTMKGGLWYNYISDEI